MAGKMAKSESESEDAEGKDDEEAGGLRQLTGARRPSGTKNQARHCD